MKQSLESDEMCMSKYGRTLKVFVMGPEFRGLKMVEVINWSGLAHIGTRDHIGILKSREELNETGIYILTSDNEEDNDGRTKIYIGETDNFANRITTHAREKDWWENFIVFTSRDLNLTKAHVRHLERELYQLAVASMGTLKVENHVEPGEISLPEPDISAMKEFIDNIKFVMETMGLSVFPSSEESDVAHATTEEEDYNDLNGTRFTTYLRGDNELLATLIAKDGKYILQKGSYICAQAVESFKKANSGYFGLWQSLVTSNSVSPSSDKDYLVTNVDITFKSPSAAGTIVYARTVNGRTKWKRASDGRTLADCQTESPIEDAA